MAVFVFLDYTGVHEAHHRDHERAQSLQALCAVARGYGCGCGCASSECIQGCEHGEKNHL